MVIRKKVVRATMALILGYAAWQYFYEPAPTILSAHVGKTFEQVARDSTYPVIERSGGSAKDMQWTYITEPSVIIHFSDPQQGFTLPPTTFVAVTYMEGTVSSITTSPMLKPLPFDDAVDVLAQVQAQFQAGHWQQWIADGDTWFDLSPAGRKRLHKAMEEPGWAEDHWLKVPGKYSMIFRLKCTSGCANVPGPERYLIDVSVGRDR